MTDQATPAASASTPTAAGAAPYGIGAITLTPGLTPSQLADEFFFLPDDVAGLPQRQITSDATSATVVYAIDAGVPVPRFGMVVALRVDPTPDAATLITTLERDRWGDPKDHDLTAAGPDSATEPAYREFSRSFPPGLFLLPNRPVFFLLWYRANDEYAFMVIGDTPTVREGLARAVAGVLSGE